MITIAGQVIVNVLLCLRDEDGVRVDIPGMTYLYQGTVNNETTRRLGERVAADVMSGGGVGGGAAAGWPVMVDEEPGKSMRHAMRLLKKGGAGAAADESGVINYEIGLLVYLQALVCLFACLRMLYFFQGNLKLGALAHSLRTIMIDILPLFALMFIFIIAFCSAFIVIITRQFAAEPQSEHEAKFKQWHHFWDAFLVMINMGVYAMTDAAILAYGTDPVFEPAEQRFVLIMFQLYMLFVQLILLNMLIAIMSESHTRVSEQSQLVALSGRAELILEYEGDEVARHMKKAKAWEAAHKRRRGREGSRNSLDLARLQEEHEERHLLKMQRVCPRWLHILKPPEHQRSSHTGDDVTLRQLKEQLQQVAEECASSRATQKRILVELSSRDVHEERRLLMQAMRVEMSQLREDLKEDMEGSGKGQSTFNHARVPLLQG
jgi:hypothetical protein